MSTKQKENIVTFSGYIESRDIHVSTYRKAGEAITPILKQNGISGEWGMSAKYQRPYLKLTKENGHVSEWVAGEVQEKLNEFFVALDPEYKEDGSARIDFQD